MNEALANISYQIKKLAPNNQLTLEMVEFFENVLAFLNRNSEITADDKTHIRKLADVLYEYKSVLQEKLRSN